jgi:hypothetical protein
VIYETDRKVGITALYDDENNEKRGKEKKRKKLILSGGHSGRGVTGSVILHLGIKISSTLWRPVALATTSSSASTTSSASSSSPRTRGDDSFYYRCRWRDTRCERLGLWGDDDFNLHRPFPIDQPVVILLEGLVAISLPLEMHSGNAFGPAGAIVMKGNLTKRANGRMEQFLNLGLVHILGKVRNNNFVGGLRANGCCDDSFCWGIASDTGASSRTDTGSAKNLSTSITATSTAATDASRLGRNDLVE